MPENTAFITVLNSQCSFANISSGTFSTSCGACGTVVFNTKGWSSCTMRVSDDGSYPWGYGVKADKTSATVISSASGRVTTATINLSDYEYIVVDMNNNTGWRTYTFTLT